MRSNIIGSLRASPARLAYTGSAPRPRDSANCAISKTVPALYRISALSLFIAALLCCLPAGALASEFTVPLLHVGNDYFTNANLSVSDKSQTHVSVVHSRGMSVVKAADLDPWLQQKLGYKPQTSKAAAAPVPIPSTNAATDSAAAVAPPNA